MGHEEFKRVVSASVTLLAVISTAAYLFLSKGPYVLLPQAPPLRLVIPSLAIGLILMLVGQVGCCRVWLGRKRVSGKYQTTTLVVGEPTQGRSARDRPFNEIRPPASSLWRKWRHRAREVPNGPGRLAGRGDGLDSTSTGSGPSRSRIRAGSSPTFFGSWHGGSKVRVSICWSPRSSTMWLGRGCRSGQLPGFHSCTLTSPSLTGPKRFLKRRDGPGAGCSVPGPALSPCSW